MPPPNWWRATRKPCASFVSSSVIQRGRCRGRTTSKRQTWLRTVSERQPKDFANGCHTFAAGRWLPMTAAPPTSPSRKLAVLRLPTSPCHTIRLSSARRFGAPHLRGPTQSPGARPPCSMKCCTCFFGSFSDTKPTFPARVILKSGAVITRIVTKSLLCASPSMAPIRRPSQTARGDRCEKFQKKSKEKNERTDPNGNPTRTCAVRCRHRRRHIQGNREHDRRAGETRSRDCGVQKEPHRSRSRAGEFARERSRGRAAQRRERNREAESLEGERRSARGEDRERRRTAAHYPGADR